MTSTEMFARKIRSVFDKPILNMKEVEHTVQKLEKNYKEIQKVFYRMYQTGKIYWKAGTIVKRIGRMIYLLKGPKMVHKRHLNQTKSRHTDEEDDTPVDVNSNVYVPFLLNKLDTLVRVGNLLTKSSPLIMVNFFSLLAFV